MTTKPVIAITLGALTMFAQQPDKPRNLQPELVGKGQRATPIPEDKPFGITNHGRHRVIQFSDGAQVVIYRHDLVSPALTLTRVYQNPNSPLYHYEYSLANDAAALEAINQIVFWPAGTNIVRYLLPGVQPGDKTTLLVDSEYAPGPVRVTFKNLDAIREAQYLATLDHPGKAVGLEHADTVSRIRTPEIELLTQGPSIAPKSK